MSASVLSLQLSNGKEAQQETSGFSWFEVSTDPSAWNQLVRPGLQRMFNLSFVLEAHASRRSRIAGIIVRQTNDQMLSMGALISASRSWQSLKMLTFPSLASTGDPGLIMALSEWLFAQQIEEIQLDSYTGGVEGYQLPAVGAVRRDRLEFEWDLQSSAEERFRALRSNHKRGLKRLLAQPLELRRVERYQAEQMTRLRVQWSRRRNMPSGFRRIVRMYQYHRLLQQKLTRSGVANLYGLYDKAGDLLSLAYMLEVDGVAFYMIGASSSEGYRLNSSLRLFWELANHYSDRNYQLLHLGGVSAEAISANHEEHGVLRFKAGFGIESTIRTSLSIKK